MQPWAKSQILMMEKEKKRYHKLYAEAQALGATREYLLFVENEPKVWKRIELLTEKIELLKSIPKTRKPQAVTPEQVARSGNDNQTAQKQDNASEPEEVKISQWVSDAIKKNEEHDNVKGELLNKLESVNARVSFIERTAPKGIRDTDRTRYAGISQTQYSRARHDLDLPRRKMSQKKKGAM